VSEKHEEAEKRLEEINKKLKALEEKGVRIDFAEAATKSIEKILEIVADIEGRGERQRFEKGSFMQGPAKVDYRLGVQIGFPALEKPVERKPLLQVLEEGKNLRIVAEFPGVKENEIEIKLEGKELVIRIPKEGFESKILLPAGMKLVQKSFKNSVLELLLEKLY